MVSFGYNLAFLILQAGVIEEMVNDAVDTALDSEDIEEEIEEEVDKVLAAIAGETASQLPDAVRREKVQQPVATEAASEVGHKFILHFNNSILSKKMSEMKHMFSVCRRKLLPRVLTMKVNWKRLEHGLRKCDHRHLMMSSPV